MNHHLLFLSVMFLGHISHTLKTVVQLREMDRNMTLMVYVKDRPYKTALALCGSLVGYILLNDSGQLTLMAALGVGYMADSVFEIAANKTRTQF
jgi:hypothetical protein